MNKVLNYLYLIIGILLVAMSFNLFLSPYHLAAGGISGLSLIINKLFHVNESIFIFLANFFLLVISYIYLGKEKTRKTILGSLLFPIFVSITSSITNYIKIDDLELIVIAVLGGITSGVGYGIIFKSGHTSGGTDIINQIMEKYLYMPISKSIIIVDGIITLFGILAFNFTTMIYAFISLIFISIFTNKTIIGNGNAKIIYIYSKKYKEIKDYLHQELMIDSTDFDCYGGFKNKKGKLILTVVDSRKYYQIKQSVKLIDNEAFIVVTNSYHLVNANISIRT